MPNTEFFFLVLYWAISFILYTYYISLYFTVLDAFFIFFFLQVKGFEEQYEKRKCGHVKDLVFRQ